MPRPWIVLAFIVAACGDVDHGDVDEAMDTEKGPGKLRGWVADGSLDPDLSAHAAQNLVILGEDSAVLPAFEKLSPERRAKVLAKLAPRLWKLARIEGDLTAASGQQSAAKDLLFELRGFADDATRATIDGYLTEWFTGGYYEDRSGRGRIAGEVVMRALGPAAGPAMLRAANAVIAAPEQAGGKRVRIGDRVLLGLAVTGDPEATKRVLDLVTLDRGDPSLAERAVDALYRAYVEPPGQAFPPAEPAGLTPNLPALALIARDRSRPNGMINDAFDLIEAAGPPGCVDTLVPMVEHPENVRYLWVAATRALACGGVAAIAPVIQAMPESGDYEHQAMEDAIIAEIVKMEPREQVLVAARTLVGGSSPVARWVGIEVLAALGSRDDASRIAGLAGDKAVLQGYWGEVTGKGKMTVGKRASELAKSLQ